LPLAAGELRSLAGLEAMKARSGSEHLSAIAVRSLIIWGDRDQTYPWAQIESLWRQIPDSHLSVLPDCAHAVHAECPQIFNLQLDEFLTSKM
jgi:2-hydroxy-6-oxonona-2,4-dienedioate hydrolase